VAYFISKASWTFYILINSRALLAVIHCWLATLKASQVAARFWHFHSQVSLASSCLDSLCFSVSISNS